MTEVMLDLVLYCLRTKKANEDLLPLPDIQKVTCPTIVKRNWSSWPLNGQWRIRFGSTCWGISSLFTDNNPLSYLKTAKLGAVEQRWVSELAAFDFEVQYRPGTVNRNAEALSRQPTCNLISSVIPGIQVPNMIRKLATDSTSRSHQYFGNSSAPNAEKENLQALQDADQVIGAFKDCWQRTKGPLKQELTAGPKGVRKLVQQWNKICMRNGVLYRSFRQTRTGK